MYYTVCVSYQPRFSEEETDYGEGVLRRAIKEEAGGELVNFLVKPDAAELILGVNVGGHKVGKFDVPRPSIRCPECGGRSGHKDGCKLGAIQKAISAVGMEIV